MSERSSSTSTSPTYFTKNLHITHVLHKKRTSMGRSIRGVHLKEREKLFYVHVTNVLL
jgi:hypothetical protein